MSETQQKPQESDFPIHGYRLVPAEKSEIPGENDEIDLIALAKRMWNKRILIVRFLFLGALFGVFVAIFTPKEYKSESKLMPEYSSSSQGGASSLLQRYGGLLGINADTYNSSSNALRVDLYPQIVSSLPFQMDLAATPFYISEYDTTVSLMTYYKDIKTPGLLSIIKGYTIDLPGKIIRLILPKTEAPVLNDPATGTSTIISLSKDELTIIQYLQSRVTARLDQESGIITVSAIMDDPILAAHVTEFTINRLTDYLTEYRTQKLRTDLEFIEEQLVESKIRFETVQEELSAFREQFQGTVSIRNQTEQQRLNSEYQIAFNLYNTFSQRLEETKLKLQEETPLFKELEPVKVPVNDESSGAMTLIIYVTLSGILSIGWIFVQPLLDEFRNTPPVNHE